MVVAMKIMSIYSKKYESCIKRSILEIYRIPINTNQYSRDDFDCFAKLQCALENDLVVMKSHMLL